MLRAYTDPSRAEPLGERLFGVRHQVEHHLLQLERVGPRAREVGIEHDVQLDPRRAQRIAAQGKRVGDDRVQVGVGTLGGLVSREGEQVGDDLRRARGLVMDRLHRLPGLRVERRAGRDEQLRVRQHAGERIVQLVRHATHQLSHRRELLLLQELLGEALVVGHVTHDAERAGDDALLDHRRGDERAMPHAAIGGVVAERASTALAGERIVQQLARRGEVTHVHHTGERSAKQLLATATDTALERAVYRGEASRRVHGEDAV